MPSHQPMFEEELLSLLNGLDDKQLPAAIQPQRFTLETVQHLKDYSAEFHATDPGRALQIAEEAYRLGNALSGPSLALSAWALGNAYVHNGRYKDADDLFNQAREHYIAADNQLDAARMGVGHVGILAYTGKADAALALAVTINPILVKASKTDSTDLQRLGKLLMNTGVAHELLGQYEEALLVYGQQKEIAETLDDPLMLAQLTNNRAYALVQIGVYAEAVSTYQQAEKLFLVLNTPHDLIRLYYNHAALLMILKRYREARALQNKAGRLLTKLAGAELQRHWLALIRVLLDLQAKWPITTASIVQLRQAQEAFARHGPIFAAGLAALVIGRAYMRGGEWQAAQDAFQEAARHAEQYADRVLQYRVTHGIGELAAAQNQSTAAITAYTAAIQQIERIREEFHIETLRADFLTDKLVIYQELAQLYVNTDQLTMAFQVVERAKARLVSEKLTFRLRQEAASLQIPDDPILNQRNLQLQRTLETLDGLYKERRGQKQLDPNEAVPEATAAAVATLERDVQTLVYQIQHQRPLFSVYATGEPVPVERLQKRLSGRFLLQFYINQGGVWVFILDETGNLSHHYLASLTEVETAQQALSASIEHTLNLSTTLGFTKIARYFPTLLADSQSHLQQLYQLLFAPLVPHLADINKLIIVPDQTLHYVPFHALFDGQHYLLERYTISYIPSATILDLCLEEKLQGNGILVCGYDNQELAAVSTESQMIQQLIPSAKSLLGAACRADEILQIADQYRILHLATHAKFRMDQPLLSALTFADRNLTLLEIARLHLKADLVVLSGCETGRGQLRGTDLLSLASGFLSAGTSSLLVSLWRVEDIITAQLMHTFYDALLAGHSRAEALRQAQLVIIAPDMQDSPQIIYSHPAYWAPFTLIGNWHPMAGLGA